MPKIPKKGSYGWFALRDLGPNTAGIDLGKDLDDIEVAIQYLSADAADGWDTDYGHLSQMEIMRVWDLRKAHKREDAPELWEPNFATTEHLEALRSLVKKNLKQAIVRLRGIEGATVDELIESLSFEQRGKLRRIAQEKQRLDATGFFCCAS